MKGVIFPASILVSISAAMIIGGAVSAFAQPSEIPTGIDSARPGLKSSYDSHQCAGLIEECLGLTPAERNSCLRSTSEHIFCHGGKLGRLAYKRWHLSSLAGNASEQLADQECLNKFDNHLFSRLISRRLNAVSVSELSDALSACATASDPIRLVP
ncbi:MAG: hypothetical protein J5J00_07215 [Deltaproteobacteria bacterium]|nr:hypothetical protein [Deltaproteobacteria bacterium]